MSISSPSHEGTPALYGPGKDIETIGCKTKNDRIQRSWFLKNNGKRRGAYRRLDIADAQVELENDSDEFCAGIYFGIQLTDKGAKNMRRSYFTSQSVH